MLAVWEGRRGTRTLGVTTPVPSTVSASSHMLAVWEAGRTVALSGVRGGLSAVRSLSLWSDDRLPFSGGRVMPATPPTHTLVSRAVDARALTRPKAASTSTTPLLQHHRIAPQTGYPAYLARG